MKTGEEKIYEEGMNMAYGNIQSETDKVTEGGNTDGGKRRAIVEVGSVKSLLKCKGSFIIA